MAQRQGTAVEARFERVVDGDTVRVFLPGASESESLRLMALDTEESHAGGTKPVTPWGQAASQFAKSFFEGARTVAVELPGTETLEGALVKHRDNFGRLLCFVHKGDVDYQEVAIAEGYSPYFMKYGHVPFAARRARYERAERLAQRKNLGLWDQQRANGSEMRNYAALGTWWRLRGRLIDHYRSLRAVDPSLLNSRLDYELLREKATRGEQVTVFSELRNVRPTRGGDSSIVDIGSEAQPFKFFIPGSDQGTGNEVLQLLLNRYIAGGESHPRLGYAFASGTLQLFRDEPEIVLVSPDQITDHVKARADVEQADVRIVALVANPEGRDAGAESVTLHNAGSSPVDLGDFALRDRAGSQFTLSGEIGPGQEHRIVMPAGKVPLNNTGDAVMLIKGDDRVVHEVSYEGSEVEAGQPILFG